MAEQSRSQVILDLDVEEWNMIKKMLKAALLGWLAKKFLNRRDRDYRDYRR